MQTKHVKIGQCESDRLVWQTVAFGLSAISPNLPARPSVLLLLLLLSVDLAPSGTRLNAGNSFKSKTGVDNKRHTNAHQPLTSHSPMGVSIPPSPPYRFMTLPVTASIGYWVIHIINPAVAAMGVLYLFNRWFYTNSQNDGSRK